MSTGAKRYHHGELRGALLAAALDVLERDGPGALSLRALARAVGVSAMAPYHHFPDRMALLAAVATAGFDQMHKRKLLTENAHVSVPEALAKGAADYVQFILDSPNLYRLMKGREFADRERFPDLHKAAAAPAQILLTLLTALLKKHDLHQPTPEQGAMMLWGLAHGVGTLALDGQLPMALAPALAHDGAEAMIKGWLKS
ncbi:HTH tetR-type domain-containing protein [Sphingomonas antarctica]|uniref:TetR/AcrR family transcriptional regulator n=1 Tax=Sphingomonas antarctica TaxID=2040274 RepID=UPI0039E9B924